MRKLMRMISLMCSLIIIAMSGCVSTEPYRVQKKCAWCRAQIVDAGYGIYTRPLTHDFLVERRNNSRAASDNRSMSAASSGGVMLGAVATKEEAIQLCEKDAKVQAGGDTGIAKDGQNFCSLRCVNAFEASQGIKEQRIRTIQGE